MDEISESASFLNPFAGLAPKGSVEIDRFVYLVSTLPTDVVLSMRVMMSLSISVPSLLNNSEILSSYTFSLLSFDFTNVFAWCFSLTVATNCYFCCSSMAWSSLIWSSLLLTTSCHPPLVFSSRLSLFFRSMFYFLRASFSSSFDSSGSALGLPAGDII